MLHKIARIIGVAALVGSCSISMGQYIDNTQYMGKNVNQFRLINDTLKCIANPADSLYGYLPCLQMGGIWMRNTLSEVKQRYGKVYKVQADHNGSEAHIFLLKSDNPKEIPYLAVLMKEGKISGLEITGNETSRDVFFSGLQLGDKEKKVLSTLGKPSQINVEDDLMHWDYAPYPFYLLMDDKKIHSITVTNDGGGATR